MSWFLLFLKDFITRVTQIQCQAKDYKLALFIEIEKQAKLSNTLFGEMYIYGKNLVNLKLCIHSSNHNVNQDRKHLQHPKRYSWTPSKYILSARDSHSLDFYHHRFLLLVLKLYVEWNYTVILALCSNFFNIVSVSYSIVWMVMVYPFWSWWTSHILDL